LLAKCALALLAALLFGELGLRRCTLALGLLNVQRFISNGAR
jgi:hypothetical protein